MEQGIQKKNPKKGQEGQRKEMRFCRLALFVWFLPLSATLSHHFFFVVLLITVSLLLYFGVPGSKPLSRAVPLHSYIKQTAFSLHDLFPFFDSVARKTNA